MPSKLMSATTGSQPELTWTSAVRTSTKKGGSG